MYINKIIITIDSENDIIIARKKAREVSEGLKFSSINRAKVLTAVSELSRNIYRYAGTGELELEILPERIKRGVKITASDKGPGIVDISKAMRKGYSTSGSLGAGIPGVKTIMDEFSLETSPGSGTQVTVVKWELL